MRVTKLYFFFNIANNREGDSRHSLSSAALKSTESKRTNVTTRFVRFFKRWEDDGEIDTKSSHSRDPRLER